VRLTLTDRLPDLPLTLTLKVPVVAELPTVSVTVYWKLKGWG